MSAERRLRLLELTRPAVSNPDIGLWIKMASELEMWCEEAGQEETPRQTTLHLPSSPKPGQPRGPARK